MHARTMLNRVPPPLPFRWSANPYRGCSHGCSYCYARPSHVRFELGGGADFEQQIFVKVNAAEVLRAELHRPGWRHEVVNIGTIVDPYQPVEGRYRITHQMLIELARARTPAHVVTKNSMVVRDIDVLTELHARAGCAIFVSVTTLDDALARRMEPGTPPPLSRLAAVERLVRAGIPAGVMAAPLLPGINDRPAQLEALAAAAAAHSACFFIGVALHLSPNVEPYFFPWLADERPNLLPAYRRLYRRTYAPTAYVEHIRAQIHALRAAYGLPASPPEPRPTREPAQLAFDFGLDRERVERKQAVVRVRALRGAHALR
jgi:DNA repair photolyase